MNGRGGECFIRHHRRPRRKTYVILIGGRQSSPSLKWSRTRPCTTRKSRSNSQGRDRQHGRTLTMQLHHPR
eukprot:4806700-Prorocentrum_lima.AAC.1